MSKNNFLAINLKKIRKAMGLRQEEMAMLLGCARCSLSKYESQLQLPDLGLLENISSNLGVSLSDLLYKDLDPIALSIDPTNFRSQGILLMNVLFPLFRSLELDRIPEFVTAYESSVQFITSCSNPFAPMSMRVSSYKTAVSLYKNMIRCGNTASEIIANLVCLYFNSFLIYATYFSDWWESFLPTLFVDIPLAPPSAQLQQALVDFQLTPSQKLIMDEAAMDGLIRILQASSRQSFRDLGDYYQAMRYILCYTRNGNFAENYSFGRTLMQQYNDQGNSRCRDIHEAILRLFPTDAPPIK